MMNRDGDDNVDSTNPIISVLVDDNIIVWEILSRLPVKSLVRFKCVCKSWRNIIQNDLQFRDLHLNRRLRFITDLCPDGTERIVGIPINGLICFQDLQTNSVRIYNIREYLTPWIKSNVVKELEEEQAANIRVKIDKWRMAFGFGYDPATKEHKVICVWGISREAPLPQGGDIEDINTVCEVLTVGQNSWRKIDNAFPNFFTIDNELSLYNLRGAVSVCVNGVIYWRRCPRFHSHFGEKGDDFIWSFDLGSEKFGVIQIPSFILNQPQALQKFSGVSVGLLEVDGRLALLHRMNAKIAKLWVFDDDNNWIEETISLRFGSSEVHFQSIAGTDQIIVTCNKYGVAYSYDRKRKTWKKVYPHHSETSPSNESDSMKQLSL